MRSAIVILPICLAALCGCADPSQFQAPIATFSSASSSAATSFAALDALSAARLTALREAEAVQSGSVTPSQNGCAANWQGCVLQFQKQGSAIYFQVSYNSLMPKSVAFVNGIRDYAAALDAIEKADASAAVQAAFGSAMGAMAAVAGAVNVPAGAAVTAISKPLTAVVGWGFIRYQNTIKLEALQKATSAAQTIITEAVPVLDDELTLANEAQLATLEANWSSKDQAFSEQPTTANLAAEVDAANALDTALLAKSSSLITALASAHGKLTSAVQAPSESITDLAAAITAFAQQAQNVQQIVKAATPPAKN
jgi:hypothetical protein